MIDDSELGELLERLAEVNVRLHAEGDTLRYDAPAGALTPELLEAMRAHKACLLDRLRGVHSSSIAPAGFGQARAYQATAANDVPQTLTIALRLGLRGPVDMPALRAALEALVIRHPALRTRYQWRGEQIWQQVLAPNGIELPVVTVAVPEVDDEMLRWARRPFDLDAGSAFRALLLIGAEAGVAARWDLVLAMHHGISDGWSVAVLLRDLGELYRAGTTGTPAVLPELTVDYVDFTTWERDYLADEATVRMVREWADSLGPERVELAPLELPTDRPAPERLSGAGGLVTITLPPVLLAEVNSVAVTMGATLFAALSAMFALLTHQLTGTPTVVLATGVANRPSARFDDVVGLFMHSPWLVIPVSGATSMAGLVDRASADIRRLLAMQSVPVAVLNEAMGGRFRTSSRRTVISFTSTAEPVLNLPGQPPVLAEDLPLGGARADLTWLFAPRGEAGMVLEVEYSADLFDRATVAGWMDRYLKLLESLVADPYAALPPAEPTG